MYIRTSMYKKKAIEEREREKQTKNCNLFQNYEVIFNLKNLF